MCFQGARLATFVKLCAEILAVASDGVLDIEDITGVSVLQAEVPQSPPLSNRESGEVRQSQSETVTLEERQHSLQSVKCNKSPTAAKSNVLSPDKSVNFVPLNSQSTELHLNEIGRALKEFEPKKDSIHNGNPPNLPYTESCPDAFVENNSTIPAPTGNSSATLNPNLHPHLNTQEAINSACDNQSPRASMLATKPRWTRVCRVSSTPKAKVSQGNLNYGKRPLTLNDNFSKLPNKRC
nr:hypothetical protein CFP56_28119 [Quercus suber]